MFLTCLLPAGAVCVDPEKWRRIAACFRDGLHDSELPITKAARLWMDWDPAQLERGLSGTDALDARRFGMLPDEKEFWPNVSMRILEKFGFPARVRMALKISPVIQELKREA